jgi:hypothetical protein
VAFGASSVPAGRYGEGVASPRRPIDLRVKLDGERVGSETTAMRSGAYVLTISTVLPDRGVAFQLTSTFVGHRGVGTQATHLALGPVGHEPRLWSAEHDHQELDPIFRARECAYEHTQVLIEHLREHGVQASIDIDDTAFEQLERVEP